MEIFSPSLWYMFFFLIKEIGIKKISTCQRVLVILKNKYLK